MERSGLPALRPTTRDFADPTPHGCSGPDAQRGHGDAFPPVTAMFGDYNQPGPWTDRRELRWSDLAALLTTHGVGPKEGSCIVPAIFRGTRRHKADAEQIDVAFLDSDSGATLEEIAAAVLRLGWAAIISSTHSHLTTRTTVKRKSWERFARGESSREAAFLVQEKGFRETIAANACIVEETADSVTFAHQPCPKFRVAIPLWQPWRASAYETQAAANAAWKERIEALAAALCLDHDQACTDTSRLFYLPRTPPDGATPETRVIDGGPCDLFQLPRRDQTKFARSPRHAATSSLPASGMLLFTDTVTGEAIDLMDWARTHGSRFMIAAALRARRPDVLTGHVVDGSKVHLQCVNADAHTTMHADKATFVIDAGKSDNGGFVYHCRHNHCDGRDRLFFLRRMLEEGWLAIADLTDPAFQRERTDTPAANENARDDGRTSNGPSFLLTEHGVAQAFVSRHRDRLRYCHDTGAWFFWNDTKWRQDKTKRAFDWARRLAAELSQNREFKMKVTTGKATFASAVERLAQADPSIACTMEAWNPDPFLLGTPNGTIDLHTGILMLARQSDFITKLTAVGPSATADCPQWLAFLEQATAEDQDLVAFLRRWCGYVLTGDTREHALLFIYGPGGNGKSVFINTVQRIAGEYCRTASMDTFTASHGDKHPTDLAMLHGARMVLATETEEGRAWAESRIKQMTGGDMIAARFMRQDFFEYRPAFKLTIAGNHKPVLRNVDNAARRRFNIVPFIRRPAAPDRELEKKLEAEWPGILRWMIDGCLDWLANGLKPPSAVREATDEYFQSQDVIGRWLSERCIVDPGLTSKPGELLADCRGWAAQNGETLPTPPQFRSAIEKTAGVRYVTVKGIQQVRGIGMHPPATAYWGDTG